MAKSNDLVKYITQQVVTLYRNTKGSSSAGQSDKQGTAGKLANTLVRHAAAGHKDAD